MKCCQTVASFYVILICHFRTYFRLSSLSDISYFPSLPVGVLSSFLRLSLPNFLYACFHLSLHLHIRQTLTAPPSQYNEIESRQIERSHFYSCQLIIEETDSCSTKGKRGGSDGGMGGFRWERLPEEVGQELFYTQNFFFSCVVLSGIFVHLCSLEVFFLPPLSKCIQGLRQHLFSRVCGCFSNFFFKGIVIFP